MDQYRGKDNNGDGGDTDSHISQKLDASGDDFALVGTTSVHMGQSRAILELGRLPPTASSGQAGWKTR